MREQAEKVFLQSVVNLGLIRCKEIMLAIEQGTSVEKLAKVFPASNASKTVGTKCNAGKRGSVIAAGKTTAQEKKLLGAGMDKTHKTGATPLLDSFQSINRGEYAVEFVKKHPGLRVRDLIAMLVKETGIPASKWSPSLYTACNKNQTAYKGLRLENGCMFPPA